MLFCQFRERRQIRRLSIDVYGKNRSGVGRDRLLDERGRQIEGVGIMPPS